MSVLLQKPGWPAEPNESVGGVSAAKAPRSPSGRHGKFLTVESKSAPSDLLPAPFSRED